MLVHRVLPALLFAAAAISYGATPAPAANARQPYSNVDGRVDQGGATGDSQVDRLNQQQLDLARAQSGIVAVAPRQPSVGQPSVGQPTMGQPMLGAPLMQQTVPGTVMTR